MAEGLSMHLASGEYHWTSPIEATSVVVAPGAQLHVFCSASLCAHPITWTIGAEACCVLEVLDEAACAHSHWIFSLSERSQCRVNHGMRVSGERHHTVTVLGAQESVMTYRLGVHVLGQGHVHHTLEAALCADRQRVDHAVHGVAEEGGRGHIISRVRMPKGAQYPSASQTLKALSSGQAAWVLEPDLVAEHEAVEARHGAALGMIPESYLRYAQSRGLAAHIFHALYYQGFIASVFMEPSVWLTEKMHV